MATINDWTCEAAKTHHVEVSSSVWETKKADYIAGNPITIGDVSVSSSDNIIIFVRDDNTLSGG